MSAVAQAGGAQAGQEYEPIVVTDSLAADPGERFELVLTNPPFGKKSSITIVADDGKAVKERETYERDDFWATTSSKQLNFLQHVKTLLKINGRAAIVVPDNVLFFDKKQASETALTKKLWIHWGRSQVAPVLRAGLAAKLKLILR
ncbi:MAG: SAM-dependent DNA methyltransferase [Deltaproteobacteria bacterium]|nr:SAM-dependent DNA methyltransferase [Deltaproteobacteria bacterium]